MMEQMNLLKISQTFYYNKKPLFIIISSRQLLSIKARDLAIITTSKMFAQVNLEISYVCSGQLRNIYIRFT